MPNILSSTALIFRVHLVSVLRSRRTLVCLLLALFPPLILYLGQRFGPSVAASERGLAHVAWFLSLQVVAPLLSLVAGSAVISEEIENRTITYVFTRPVARPALLYGRLLATLVLVMGLLGASAGGVAAIGASATAFEPAARSRAPQAQDAVAGSRLRHKQREEISREIQRYNEEVDPQTRAANRRALLRRFVAASLLGGAAYTLLFAVLGVLLRHPMIVGLGYAFAIEVLLANLPGQSQTLSIQYWLRGMIVDLSMPIFRDMYPWELADFSTPAQSVSTLGWLLVFGLLLGGWAIRRRQYELTA